MTVGDELIYRIRDMIGDHSTPLTFRRCTRGGWRAARWTVKGGGVDLRSEWTAKELLAFPMWRVDEGRVYPVVA